MTKPIVTFALAAALVLVWAGAGAAAGVAKAPKSLVLQRADFPSGALEMFDLSDRDLSSFKPRLQSNGIDYEAATTTALGYSSAKGALHVITTVFVTPSVAVAKEAYRLLQPASGQAFWVTGGAPLAVGPYGDERVARLKTAGSEGIWFVKMVVRKRATVWAFHVMSERRPALGKSEVLATFEKFARKQKSRIGNG